MGSGAIHCELRSRRVGGAVSGWKAIDKALAWVGLARKSKLDDLRESCGAWASDVLPKVIDGERIRLIEKGDTIYGEAEERPTLIVGSNTMVMHSCFTCGLYIAPWVTDTKLYYNTIDGSSFEDLAWGHAFHSVDLT